MARKNHDKCLLKGLGLAILYLGITPLLWGMPSIHIWELGIFRDDGIVIGDGDAPKIHKRWR